MSEPEAQEEDPAPDPSPGPSGKAHRAPPWIDYRGALLRPMRNLVAALVPDEPPLELQIVGRTLLHAALVGLLAGLVGVAFLWILWSLDALLIVDLCGFDPMYAAGEPHHDATASPLRWYVLVALPAVGGIVSGLITRYAPETRGGGGDAAITAFHHHGGDVRRRVLWAKPLSAIATLGSGGSGGREGPTMHIGAAIGSAVGRYLSLSGRERRTLMVAGIAAGISAVFRTPLGAALLAIEVLYRDDFESEALIPAVLGSVVAYSVSIAVFGTQPLFGKLPAFPFHPAQLPLYLGLALVVSVGATLFAATMRSAKKMFLRVPGPDWARPAAGGLALGIFVVALLFTLDPWIGNGHRGLSLIGGGYGGGQLAISGAPWAPTGWTMVELLFVLALAKIVASSLTIGSGGSAGDFAPSIAIGGLLGGAYGLGMQLALADPTISPGAYALVGMAAFYAGIANVPLAALVMVCEVAGSYDLLVPLMLTEGVAMIALRRVNLYRAQPRTTKDSPVHASPLSALRCGEVIVRDRTIVTLRVRMPISEVATTIEDAADQDVFPVLDDNNKVVGLLSAESLRTFVAHEDAMTVTIVADVMVAPLAFAETDEVKLAAHQLVKRDLRAAPVLDATGKVLGMIDQHDIVRALTVVAANPNESIA